MLNIRCRKEGGKRVASKILVLEEEEKEPQDRYYV